MTATCLRAPLFALAAALMLQGSALAQQLEHRKIDAPHSSAQFSVRHIWVERVTGTVPIESGEVVLRRGSSVPVSVSAVLDPAKVQTNEPDRDNALRSSDFFDVNRYPQWTFASTAIISHGDSSFEMDGELTIHGVTQAERLDVTVTGDALHPVYRARGTINRRAFGMTVTRLDPVIGASARVTLDIELR